MHYAAPTSRRLAESAGRVATSSSVESVLTGHARDLLVPQPCAPARSSASHTVAPEGGCRHRWCPACTCEFPPSRNRPRRTPIFGSRADICGAHAGPMPVTTEYRISTGRSEQVRDRNCMQAVGHRCRGGRPQRPTESGNASVKADPDDLTRKGSAHHTAEARRVPDSPGPGASSNSRGAAALRCIRRRRGRASLLENWLTDGHYQFSNRGATSLCSTSGLANDNFNQHEDDPMIRAVGERQRRTPWL
jgi:hypothetical protein